jgi:hypothetical protein
LSSSSSSISSSSTAFEAYFDDSYWTATYGSWSVDRWVSEEVALEHWIGLLEIGTWNEGFRPDKIRLTVNYDNFIDLIVYDSTSGIIVNQTDISSLEQFTINWNGSDLASISLIGPGAIELTNIEFLGG